jgi:hypothetical protein
MLTQHIKHAKMHKKSPTAMKNIEKCPRFPNSKRVPHVSNIVRKMQENGRGVGKNGGIIVVSAVGRGG